MTKRNENKAGYKKTKVGWIPEEWKVVRLKDCAEILFSNVDKKINSNEYPVALCNYTDVYYNELITNEIKFMRATATKAEFEKFSIRKGDVIITKDSEDANDIAVPALVADDFNNVLCGYHLALIRPDRKTLLGEYLSKLFQLHVFRHYFSTLANGVTRFGLTSPVTFRAQIPLPPLVEQKKIAEIFSAWDRAIEQVGRLIDAKDRLKKGLMQQLLTGRMRFPEFGKPVEKKGQLPEGWQKVRLRELFEQIKEKVGQRKVTPFSISAGIGFVPQSEKWGKDISGKQYPNYTLLKKDQFSYNKGNSKKYSCGCAYLWKDNSEIAVPNVFISFKSKNNNICNYFYEQYFVANMWERELKKYISSSARSDGLLNLSNTNFFKVKVPCPPHAEQTRIAAVLFACDREIELLKKKQKQLKTQKKGLMQKLLTGEVRHPDILKERYT